MGAAWVGIGMSLFRRLWVRLQLATLGYAFLRWEKRPNWLRPLPIYLVRCRKHGLFEDYPHGWDETFICPKCAQEIFGEWDR